MDQYRYPTVSSFFEYIHNKQVIYMTQGSVVYVYYFIQFP
jgi:hypothetical protein